MGSSARSADSPVTARSVHGEMLTPAAGRATPASRSATNPAMTSPPPAESPANAMRPGGMPSAAAGSVDRDQVVDGRGVRVLGRAAVVDVDTAAPDKRAKAHGDREVRVGAHPDVPAAMDEHDGPVRVGASWGHGDAGDAADGRLLDVHVVGCRRERGHLGVTHRGQELGSRGLLGSAHAGGDDLLDHRVVFALGHGNPLISRCFAGDVVRRR